VYRSVVLSSRGSPTIIPTAKANNNNKLVATATANHNHQYGYSKDNNHIHKRNEAIHDNHDNHKDKLRRDRGRAAQMLMAAAAVIAAAGGIFCIPSLAARGEGKRAIEDCHWAKHYRKWDKLVPVEGIVAPGEQQKYTLEEHEATWYIGLTLGRRNSSIGDRRDLCRRTSRPALQV